jgi:hypothetical protein
MRTHTYICKKGYPEKFKGTEIRWQVPQNVAEAISSGQFKDEDTIVAYAVAQLNIRKGHAISDAVNEKDKDGKAVGLDLTTADLTKIAEDVKADGVRTRTAGGVTQKEAKEKLTTAKTKAAELAKTADPAKLAMLRELGLLDDAAPGDAPVSQAPLAGGKGKK